MHNAPRSHPLVQLGFRVHAMHNALQPRRFVVKQKMKCHALCVANL